MTETVKALRWSLGHPEEWSRSNNSDIDTALVESTKQQSMQEMVGFNSLLLNPDFQQP